jgi:hypothetical protein
LRDTLLSAPGRLDLAMGGKPVQITREAAPPRRTVYALVDRQDLPALFRTFDFANPDTTTPQRFDTTVPQQALFFMNSSFVVRQAEALAQRVEHLAPEARIEALYARLFQRRPTVHEARAGLAFVSEVSRLPVPAPPVPVWQHGYGYYDAGQRKTVFTPFTLYTNQAWTSVPGQAPPQIAGAFLNMIGGHVGHDLQHGVIRRWTAPAAGRIRIEGEISSERDQGDGVRGQIVHGNGTVLGTWTVQQKRKRRAAVSSVEVKQGETLDFIVDCRSNPGHDIFHWVPVIRYLEGGTGEYHLGRDFSGPEESVQLSPWGQYAQVLLLSNECLFLD